MKLVKDWGATKPAKNILQLPVESLKRVIESQAAERHNYGFSAVFAVDCGQILPLYHLFLLSTLNMWLQANFVFDRCTHVNLLDNITSQPTFTYPKLTIETLEQGVKYVQS